MTGLSACGYDFSTDCVDGNAKCTSDQKISTCKNNQWTSSECKTGQKCLKDATICTAVNEQPCKLDNQRCNNNKIEVCVTGSGEGNQYKPDLNLGCPNGSYCLEDIAEHTAKCVACKKNADCKNAEHPTCNAHDNTCV